MSPIAPDSAGTAWKPVGPDTPEGVWLITYRSGERGPTASMLSRCTGEDVWTAPDGRDTITHSIYAPPTHWLTVMPPLPPKPKPEESA